MVWGFRNIVAVFGAIFAVITAGFTALTLYLQHEASTFVKRDAEVKRLEGLLDRESLKVRQLQQELANVPNAVRSEINSNLTSRYEYLERREEEYASKDTLIAELKDRATIEKKALVVLSEFIDFESPEINEQIEFTSDVLLRWENYDIRTLPTSEGLVLEISGERVSLIVGETLVKLTGTRLCVFEVERNYFLDEGREETEYTGSLLNVHCWILKTA